MDFIRLNDTLAHGGKVTGASSAMEYDGLPLARKGDPVQCAKHPTVQPNVIAEGDSSMTEEGVPLARHHHHARCGCQLISSLS